MIEKTDSSLSQISVIYLFTTIFLVALTIFVYIQIVSLINSFNLVNHTNQVNQSLEKISKAIIGAGSHQNSYLLTGDSAMLAKRDVHFNTITNELNLLDSLTRFNAEQNENLKKLHAAISEKILSLETKLQTYTPVQIAPGFELSLDDGFRKTENVQLEINKMSALENHLLELRMQKSSRLAFITPLYTIILSLGALIVLLVSYFRITIALDLTRQLQTKLEESNKALEKKNEELIIGGERFLKIFDNSPVAMTFGELETNQVVYANNLFYKSFGYTKEEVIGHTTEELNLVSTEENERLLPIIMGYLQEERTVEELKVLPAEERANLLLKLKEKMFENGFEVLYTRKNGETFFAIVFFEVIDLGNKKYALSSYQDISERKKAAKQLEEKNKTLAKINKELESINYISSHDLQEPLRQIQIFASRISDVEQQNLSDAGKTYFDKMNTAAKRMQNLIADLLAYSRTKTEEKQFKTINLNQIINQVREELAEIIDEKHAIIEVDELGDANIIPFQFRQMLYNLIGNALKFSKPDTPPHITIKNEKLKSSQAPGADPTTETEYHHISIADNGIGFEPQYQDRIFEVFQRLHDKQKIAGTGIGLAIVKNIVENHNGIIKATGELNKGATFDIYIPTNQKH